MRSDVTAPRYKSSLVRAAQVAEFCHNQTQTHHLATLPPWRFGCWPRLMPTMKPGTHYTGAASEAEDGFWAELYFVSGWDGWRWRWRGFPGFCSPLIIQFINVWKVEPGLHFGNGAFCVSLLRGAGAGHWLAPVTRRH